MTENASPLEASGMEAWRSLCARTASLDITAAHVEFASGCESTAGAAAESPNNIAFPEAIVAGLAAVAFFWAGLNCV